MGFKAAVGRFVVVAAPNRSAGRNAQSENGTNPKSKSSIPNFEYLISVFRQCFGISGLRYPDAEALMSWEKSEPFSGEHPNLTNLRRLILFLPLALSASKSAFVFANNFFGHNVSRSPEFSGKCGVAHEVVNPHRLEYLFWYFCRGRIITGRDKQGGRAG